MRDMILVHGKPFFGRVEEQKRFRAALREVLNPPPGEDLPYVFLLYGDGGIGKTTLARRFRDIALEEVPFEGDVDVLWIDWEEERRRNVALQVGREHIAPETVFDILFTAAQRNGWEKHFQTYRDTLKKRKQAEHAAAQVLASLAERPDLDELRGASAAALAKVLRVGLGAKGVPIGETGERLARAFLDAGIRAGAEQAYRLRQALERALRARLGVEQYELYVNPLEGLARALADGFRRRAHKRALVVVLDTYEIVDRVDPWLRMVMRLSGPRTLWVLSGRDDLVHSRQFGREYLKGYAEDWPRRLVPINMLHLARNDIAAYFEAYAPERPLDEDALEALVRATRGIPLAVAQAAEMWAKERPLEDIVDDADEAVPGHEVVQRMTERYLVHAVDNEEDRYALYALALARGDRDLLGAMLPIALERDDLDLNAELRRLERRYASVMFDEARLHDDPQAFFEAHLRQEAQRRDARVRAMLERATAALEARLARLAAEYDLIEERLEDEDYQRDALTLSDFLFWLDEDRAWRWWVPRYVEALAYSPALRRGLLEVAARWADALRDRGRKRLKAFQAAEGWWPDLEEKEARLRELERLAQRGYLAGEGAEERGAILAWLRGRWLHRAKRYEEALRAYEAAARGLPPEGAALREKLAEGLHKAIRRLMWPEGRRFSVYHPDAVRILRQVVVWQPENAVAWYHLGVALDDAKEYDDAIQAYQKAIDLDPNDADPWNGLGDVYYDQRRYDDAIQAYQKAIDLDPQFADPWNGLGLVYEARGEYDEAIRHYQKALEIDPEHKWAWRNLGDVYRKQGRYDDAIQAYQKAIDLDPNYADPWNGLGNVYYDQRRYDDAIHAYKKAIDLDPNYATPWNGLGLVYEARGEYDEAIRHYQKALEIDPKFKWAYAYLGDVYRTLGRYDDAIHAYQKASDLDPKYAYPWNGLGVVYTLQDRLEEALHAYRKAVELAPDCGMCHSSLMGILRRLGHEEEARREEEIARRLMVKENAYNRACFAALTGDKDEALRLLQIALEKWPGARAWARRDPDLEPLHDDPRFWEIINGR